MGGRGEAVREVCLAGGRRGRRPASRRPSRPGCSGRSDARSRTGARTSRSCPSRFGPRSGPRPGCARGGCAVGFGHRAQSARLGFTAHARPGGDPTPRTGSRRLAATRVSAVAARAKVEGAEIDWPTRPACRTRPTTAVASRREVRRPRWRGQQRGPQSMIASLTNAARCASWSTTARHRGDLPRFLRRPVKGAERKLFVIVDNLRVHRAKRVTAGPRPMPSGSSCSTSRPDRPEGTIPTSSEQRRQAGHARRRLPGTRPR